MVSLLLSVIYLAFISLGLPDSLIGSAWPSMQKQFGVPLSYAGVITVIIALGTIISSLQSDRLTKKLGAGKVTAISVATTCLALFGFSITNNFWLLCVWAVPYGLGAGSVDACLNNYVALHFSSRHMSWLHCMWGVGASLGPYIMGNVLTNGNGWGVGYRYIGIIQLVLTVIILFSLPLWKKDSEQQEKKAKVLSLKEIIAIKGAKGIMITFFCYCALEQTTSIWASSYLVLHRNLSTEMAASWASLFFLGITVGRALSGFMTIKFSDTSMIHIGQSVILVGVISLILPLGNITALIGLLLIGLGCAPIYPSIIHSTPQLFGKENSQAVIGVQMASAYVGTCLMPPVFGLIANYINISLFPIFLLFFLALMTVIYQSVLKAKR